MTAQSKECCYCGKNCDDDKETIVWREYSPMAQRMIAKIECGECQGDYDEGQGDTAL